tara:strand:- start:177 stop:392 length:216 start_codon:yes stop_codon:yes gene_type:complete
MPSEYYDHYNILSKEDLIRIIEKKDQEIKNLLENLKSEKKLKEKYYSYNKFHMEEITRLDKTIGKLKGIRK